MRCRVVSVLPLVAGVALACSDSTGIAADDLEGSWTASAFVVVTPGSPVLRDVLSEGYGLTLTLFSDNAFTMVLTPPPPSGVTAGAQFLPRPTTRGSWALEGETRLVLTDGWSGERIALDIALGDGRLHVRSTEVGFDPGFGSVPTTLRAEFGKATRA